MTDHNPEDIIYPHRTYCDVLHEMREILKAGSQLHTMAPVLKSLVEELQVYGNRMESALQYEEDILSLHDRRKKLVTEIKELKKQLPSDDDEE